jgi:hypothetical protein
MSLWKNLPKWGPTNFFCKNESLPFTVEKSSPQNWAICIILKNLPQCHNRRKIAQSCHPGQSTYVGIGTTLLKAQFTGIEMVRNNADACSIFVEIVRNNADACSIFVEIVRNNTDACSIFVEIVRNNADACSIFVEIVRNNADASFRVLAQEIFRHRQTETFIYTSETRLGKFRTLGDILYRRWPQFFSKISSKNHLNKL